VGQADLFSRRMLQTELEGIGQYSDEICVLGIGNARMMTLAPPQLDGNGALNLTTTDSGRTLTVAQGNWSDAYHTLCPQASMLPVWRQRLLVV